MMISVPKEALKTLLNSNHVRFADHVFFGPCPCVECKLYGCISIDTYEEYLWFHRQRSFLRINPVIPTSKEEFYKNLSLLGDKKLNLKM